MRAAVVVLLLTLVGCTPIGRWLLVDPDQTVLRDLDPEDLLAKVEGEGLQVAKGVVFFFRHPQLCRFIPNCFTFNPATPYGIVVLPKEEGWPYYPVWRLRPDEAVVLLGQTPPKSRYFSFHNYLYSRQSEEGDRWMPFASADEPVHHMNIELGSHHQSGDVFNKDVALIFAADQNLVDQLTRLFLSQGLDAINVRTFDPRQLRLGLDADADELAIMLRVAFPEQDAEHYFRYPPFKVWRVTPQTEQRIKARSVSSVRHQSVTLATEEQRFPGLEGLRNEVVTQIQASAKCQVVNGEPFQFNFGLDHCLQSRRSCFGAIPDAAYFKMDGGSSLASTVKDHFVVVGVDHRATGLATYTNVAWYNRDRNVAIGNIRDEEWQGSANAWTKDNALGHLLYVAEVGFSGFCRGRSFCREISKSFPGGDAISLYFAERAYLNPQSETGPPLSHLVAPRMLRCRAAGSWARM